MVPRGDPLSFRDAPHPDECQWFRAAVENGIIQIRQCASHCRQNREPSQPRRDEFLVPHQPMNRRHLFSLYQPASFNREYLPHIAAYARAILDFGYDVERSSFSRYRSFSKNLLHKRAGQGYETDAEFYDDTGHIHLHLEAKKSPRDTDAVVASVRSCSSLDRMPLGVVKEIEYVLDLAPKYLWIVGPGSVDPATHVFRVDVEGLNARFTPVDDVPRS
ncbi:MAG: hypothetical protein HY722_03075 [Planctomycetes bacterium]|nr:hypothetical protein [Planctomycetota bacterium]